LVPLSRRDTSLTAALTGTAGVITGPGARGSCTGGAAMADPTDLIASKPATESVWFNSGMGDYNRRERYVMCGNVGPNYFDSLEVCKRKVSLKSLV
jgi:hypothetical protein